jgi:hypothetical protein
MSTDTIKLKARNTKCLTNIKWSDVKLDRIYSWEMLMAYCVPALVALILG